MIGNIHGRTTVAEASRSFNLTPSEIEAVLSVAGIPNQRLLSAIALKPPAGSRASTTAAGLIHRLTEKPDPACFHQTTPEAAAA